MTKNHSGLKIERLKFKLLLLSVAFCFNGLAQLDTLHYLPPLGVVNLSNVKPGNVHIYISTPHTEEVSFQIYDAAETQLLYS